MSAITTIPAPEKSLNNAIKALVLEATQEDLTPTDLETRFKELSSEHKIGVAPIRSQFRAEMPQNGKDLQGESFEIPEVEPWHDPVGPEVLDELKAALHHHLHLTVQDAALAALWATHTHCFTEFGFTPRLAISAPDKGCGKSVLLDVLGLVCNRDMPSVNMTPATMFRAIAKESPTLMIDEIDSWMDKDSEMTSILNAGVNDRNPVPRLSGDDYELRYFKTHAPVAMAGINIQKKLAEPTKDRSLWISMERAMPSDIPEKFNRREHSDKFRVLGRKVARWVQDNLQDIRECDPSVTPEHLINRAQDRWEPMFILAACAGGDWHRLMLLAYEAQPDTSKEERGVRMLADIRTIMGLLDIYPSTQGGIPTDYLRECLLALDTEDGVFSDDAGGDGNIWRNHNFKKSFDERHITSRQINDMLSRFIKGGKATTVRMPQTFNVNKGPGEFASPRLLDTPARGWKIDTLWRAVLRWQPDEMAK